MPGSYHAFLSYAHEDHEFVLDLLTRMRKADPDKRFWLDEERLMPGERLDPALKSALRGSVHMIAVVSRRWLEKEYTQSEFRWFLENRNPENVIAVLRFPFDPNRLPPEITERIAIEWLPNEPEPNARAWLVICRVRGVHPGKRELWAAWGRDPRRAPTHAFWGNERLILGCDRATQWEAVDRCAGCRDDEVILVPGPQGEGHGRFLERIERCVRMDPYPSTTVPVVWSPEPSNVAECEERLARALHVERDRLRAAIREGVSRQRNLVLIHRPEIRAAHPDHVIVPYYTRCLPDLLGRVRAVHGTEILGGVKMVHAVSWKPAAGLDTALARGIGMFLRPRSGWIRDRLRGADAEEALRAIEREMPDGLRVTRLPDLHRITPDEVSQWARDLPADERDEILSYLAEPLNSEELLSRIADFVRLKSKAA